MMKLWGILRFFLLKYPPDMPTAWIARAMGDIPGLTANFRTAEGLYLKLSDDMIFNAAEEEK
ncbi:MAG: hypothetical protein LUG91_07425 [Ruminococcus sp.]|nr:hypothetical protein [Ruminococcus sp.]